MGVSTREGEPMARVLVVDAANVVGSVPDGWWRDRAGAAARLHAGLAARSARSHSSCAEPAAFALASVGFVDVIRGPCR